MHRDADGVDAIQAKKAGPDFRRSGLPDGVADDAKQACTACDELVHEDVHLVDIMFPIVKQNYI